MTATMETADMKEQTGSRSLLRASEVGVERLGYKSSASVSQAIREGAFPLPIYKRNPNGSSPWMVRSDEVEAFFDSLAPVKVA